MRRDLVVLVAVLSCAACRGPTPSVTVSDDPMPTQEPSPSQSEPAEPDPQPVLMPDLVGLRERGVNESLGVLHEQAPFEIGSSWMSEPTGDCAAVDSVTRQEPAPGTPLRRRTEIEIWLGHLDLARFRGPCEPESGELGPVRGADARVARAFYRFAADPALGAPFVDGDVWVGIEGGPVHTMLAAADRADPDAWLLDASYAERIGPFSALDVVASSGGRYEVHRGVRPTCGFPVVPEVPSELAGLRAISLTSAEDSIGSCSQWFGVALFLDDGDQIAGVALRLGSP